MNRIIIVCALVMAGAAGYAAASRQPSLAPMAAPADTTPAYVTAPGYVEPVSEEIDIGSELPGRIDRVLVEEGSRVNAGQVVAILANADYVARVDSARAMLAQREAERLRIVNGARTEEKREALAGVEEADVVLADAVLERDRRRKLLDAGAVSVEDASRAERAWLVAEARRRAAGERYALVQDATRAEDRARADAAVAVARGDVEQAEAMLAKTYIKSPIDGVVLRKHFQSGESIPPETLIPVLTVGDLSRLRVRAEIDELDVAQVHVGQRAYVTADAFGDRKFAGRVTRVGESLGKKVVHTEEPSERVDTKVLEVLIDLEGASELRPRLRVDVFLDADARRGT